MTDNLLDQADAGTRIGEAIAGAVDPQPDAALVTVGNVGMFERLARDPNVPVDKLERLIELQERVMAHNAKSAFDAAFAKMQADLPEVSERGQIVVKGTLRSRYARLEDIHEACKPVLKQHGFAIRHRTEWPADKQGRIRIVGILSHDQGHSEESVFEAPMDESEYRTDIQSMGSTISYGRRYTTIDLLNITTRGADDDGASAGRPAPPEGFQAWWAVMEGLAQNGHGEFDPAWEKAKPDFKTFVVNHAKSEWAELKRIAGEADKSRRRK